MDDWDCVPVIVLRIEDAQHMGEMKCFRAQQVEDADLADKLAAVSSLCGVYFYYWACDPLVLCKEVEESLRIYLLYFIFCKWFPPLFVLQKKNKTKEQKTSKLREDVYK